MKQRAEEFVNSKVSELNGLAPDKSIVIKWLTDFASDEVKAINYSQCCTPKGTVKTIDFERTIDLLDAEIDSLKDAYHQETLADRKTQYSSMILETLHAKKKLKQ